MLESFNGKDFEYIHLTPEEMEARDILGRIKTRMSGTEATRNNRKYSKDLWEKAINDPIFKEKIDNKCVLAELGHPADRTEIDIEKACACLAETPKWGPDGYLYGIWDILNTGPGKVLKTLCNYGTKIGISSRGEGDVMEDIHGEGIVDPDTYMLETWDFVLMPANKKCRGEVVMESVGKKTLKQALTEELDKATLEQKEKMQEAIKLVEQENKTIEDLFKDAGVKKVFDKDGYFTAAAEKKYNEVAKNYYKGEDAFDALCNEEHCFKEKKDDINYDELQARKTDIENMLDDETLSEDEHNNLYNEWEEIFNKLKKYESTSVRRNKKIKESAGKVLNEDPSGRFDAIKNYRDDIEYRVNTELEEKQAEIDEILSDMDSLRPRIAELLETIADCRKFDVDVRTTLLINSQLYYRISNLILNPNNTIIELECYSDSSSRDYIKIKYETSDNADPTNVDFINKPTVRRVNDTIETENTELWKRFVWTFPRYEENIYNQVDNTTSQASSLIGESDENADHRKQRGRTAPNKEDMVGFIADHDQAYLDFLHHFGAINEKEFNDKDVAFEIKKGVYEPDISEISLEDVANWICDHKELCQDFQEKFGMKAIDAIKESISESCGDKKEVNVNESADNSGDELINELQEALKEKAQSEASIAEMQNKLAVGDAKVKALEEALAKYKDLAIKLSDKAKDSKKLGEQVSKLQEEIQAKEAEVEKLNESLLETNKNHERKLTESANQNSNRTNKLVESLRETRSAVTKLTEELRDSKQNAKELAEELESEREVSSKKLEESSKKLDHMSKLVEGYKKAANTTMNKYIESKALMLGVKKEDIRNRLAESYTITDVDRVCEDLKSYQLNISKLPFNMENAKKVRFKESKNDNLYLGISGDEIDDDLLRMAKLD